MQLARQEPIPAAGFRRRPAAAEPPHELAQVAATVIRAQRGDREALRWLYLRYKDNVFGYVCSIVADEHEAEDVTQQVFAKLLLVIGKYEPRTEASFPAWLIRLSRNAAIDHLRRRRDTLPEDAVGGGVHDGPDESGLREALGTLPDDQRNVIILRHVVGLSPGEIAHHLGRSESSIHGLHHRGRSALRSELERTGSAPSCRPALVGER
jgi:RNA polymerase sigma-70 factor (ECF subfamily)